MVYKMLYIFQYFPFPFGTNFIFLLHNSVFYFILFFINGVGTKTVFLKAKWPVQTSQDTKTKAILKLYMIIKDRILSLGGILTDSIKFQRHKYLQSHVLRQSPLQSTFKHKVTRSVTIKKLIFLSCNVKIYRMVLQQINLNNE